MGRKGLSGLRGSGPLAGWDPRAPSRPLPRADPTLHHRAPALGHVTPSLPRAHVQDDVAVLLEEVPISLLGYWHHLQVLAEEGAQ